MPAVKKAKQQTRKVYKNVGSSSLPINNVASNPKGDQIASAASIALLAGSVIAVVAGISFSYWQFGPAVSKHPIEWGPVVWSTITLAIAFVLARALLWLSFFGSAMLAAKMGGWSSLEAITRRAIKYGRFLPNGTPWASLMLVQSLMARGQWKESITVAEEEWTRTGNDKAQAQNIGPLCAAVGMATQAEGQYKDSLTWNDRAIEKINAVLDELGKPKKGLLAKATAVQGDQWTSQLRIHLAAAYFGNANVYFNSQDFRRAKENYKRAVENAAKSPDFPNKSDIIKISNDQLSRLKHA